MIIHVCCPSLNMASILVICVSRLTGIVHVMIYVAVLPKCYPSFLPIFTEF